MLPIPESLRNEISDFELFSLLYEWSYFMNMHEYEKECKERLKVLCELIRVIEDRVISVLYDTDDRMRLSCLEWVCFEMKEVREEVLCKFLDDIDWYIRRTAIEDFVVFWSQRVFDKLNSMIQTDNNPFVVAMAARHLPLFVDDGNRREIVSMLMDVFERPFQIERTAENDQLQHPHDSALYAIEEAMGSEFLGQKIGSVVAMAAPRRFDLVVANARRFLSEQSHGQ